MLAEQRRRAAVSTVREVLDGLQRLTQTAAPFDPATATVFNLHDRRQPYRPAAPAAGACAGAGPGRGAGGQAHRRWPGAGAAVGRGRPGGGFFDLAGLGFYQQTLYLQDWICLVNARHPRVAGDTPANWSLAVYQAEAHFGISSGSRYQLLGSADALQHLTHRIRLELPGFLGLSAILSTSDLIATLPRHIGETLARSNRLNGLRVLPCPFKIPGFIVKQYWHARYHHDADSRWLRGICAELFMKSASRADVAGASSYLFDSYHDLPAAPSSPNSKRLIALLRLLLVFKQPISPPAPTPRQQWLCICCGAPVALAGLATHKPIACGEVGRDIFREPSPLIRACPTLFVRRLR